MSGRNWLGALDRAFTAGGAPKKFLHEMAAEPMRQPKAHVIHSSVPDETQVVVLRKTRGRTSRWPQIVALEGIIGARGQR